MAPKPIDVYSDPRVEHKTALVNGQRYKYLLGVPEGREFRATVFLVCIERAVFLNDQRLFSGLYWIGEGMEVSLLATTSYITTTVGEYSAYI